jgi:hypothetical protein
LARSIGKERKMANIYTLEKDIKEFVKGNSLPAKDFLEQLVQMFIDNNYGPEGYLNSLKYPNSYWFKNINDLENYVKQQLCLK